MLAVLMNCTQVGRLQYVTCMPVGAGLHAWGILGRAGVRCQGGRWWGRSVPWPASQPTWSYRGVAAGATSLPSPEG